MTRFSLLFVSRFAAGCLGAVLPFASAAAQVVQAAGAPRPPIELAPGVQLPTRLGVAPIRPGAVAPDGRSAGLWAAGSDYKVSFHDGMTFYPYVGPDLPHQPVHWRTASVRAGEQELLRGAVAPAPTWRDTRCEFDLGAVVERYDVTDDGLEQSFVVTARPPAGDLVITGELTTPLSLPATAAQHGAVTLRLADGRPAVVYGAAVAIDRDGTRTPVTTAVHEGRVVLTVAADVLAHAAFPLVVDPLISSSLEAIGSPFSDVDVLTETLTDPVEQARLWFTFTMTVAAGDRDIRLWRVDSDFGGSAVDNFHDISMWDTSGGQLALAPAASRAVLVFEVDTGGNSFVAVHSHHTTDNHLVTQLVFAPTNALVESVWRPDVGGRTQQSGGSKVLVTFEREAIVPLSNTANSEVWATVFDASVFPQANAFVVAPFAVLPRPNADQERPAVNQAAVGNNWLLAFQELNNNVSNDDWDITTVAVDGAGTVVDTGLATVGAADPLLHTIAPRVAGSAGRYLLTYTTRAFELMNPKPQSALGSAVFAQRLDWDHAAGTGSLPHPETTLLSVPNNVLRNGASAHDTVSDSHWCVGLSIDNQSRYRVAKLGYTGAVVEAQSIVLSSGRTPDGFAVTFQSAERRFPIVYIENDPAGAGLIYGTMMQYDAVAPPTLLGVACGSGVWAGLPATANHQAIGTENLPLALTNAPVDSVALLFLSTAAANLPGSLFGAPGCILVPDILSGAYLGAVTATISGGNAALALDLPEFLTPATLVLQWAYLVPNANPLGMQASEGLSLELGR